MARYLLLTSWSAHNPIAINSSMDFSSAVVTVDYHRCTRALHSKILLLAVVVVTSSCVLIGVCDSRQVVPLLGQHARLLAANRLAICVDEDN